jgi:hypothetical protein
LSAVAQRAKAESDEAIHSSFARLWIASRSLSSGARSRDPLARNDGLKTVPGSLKMNPWQYRAARKRMSGIHCRGSFEASGYSTSEYPPCQRIEIAKLLERNMIHQNILLQQ